MTDRRLVKGATLVGPRKLEIREYPLPEVKDEGFLIKIRMSGICGTDKNSYKGYLNQYSGTGKTRKLPLPVIPGHENIGVVVDLGTRDYIKDYTNKTVKVGDRVVVAANISCGKCYYCRNGFPYTYCENTLDYGNTLSALNPPHLFGGWAEYMYVLPGSYVFKVPDELSDEVAVLTELMALTTSLDKAKQFSAVYNEGFRFGDTLLIQGAGPVGICHIVKARMLGAGQIIVIDQYDYRLEKAKKVGADVCLNMKMLDQQKRLEAVEELTEGRGADVIVECAGVPEALGEGFNLLRLGGMYIELGNFVDVGPIQVNPHKDLCTKNIRLIGIGGEELLGYAPSLKQMVRYQKSLHLDEIVTHRYPVDQAEEAVKKAMSGEAIKVVIADCVG